jgi:subtilisin family serine protease
MGVAFEAQLASAIVIEGGEVIARILGGMNWALQQRVRVLNMSLGIQGKKDHFLLITQLLRQRGVLPVIAIGNDGQNTSRYPGNYAESLSVGAIDEQGAVAEFSSSEKLKRVREPLVPDLVAPGVNVVSCGPGNEYLSMSGTSMATPHVAGLAALLLQAFPSKSIDEVERAIFASCKRAPGMHEDRANRGVPDGLAAFTMLDTNSVPPSGGDEPAKLRKKAHALI